MDWKLLYMHRCRVDWETTKILDSILQGQVDRIKKFKVIANFGYDAKDTLLRHCHAPDEVDDVLARRLVLADIIVYCTPTTDWHYRYYANAVLDHLHRSEALVEWGKIAKGETVPLERALGSFDLFVLHDQFGDLEEVRHLL